MPSLLDRVRRDYPLYAFLLNDREIGPLLRNAVDPSRGFSPTKFQSELMQTNWYKSRSVSHRQYTILANTDKGEFRQQIANMNHGIRMRSNQLGVRLTNNEIKWMAHTALRSGWSPDDPRIDLGISRIRRRNPSRVTFGAIRTAAEEARVMSNSEYFLPLRSKDAWKWGDMIARGIRTPEDFRALLKERAGKRFPHLRKHIKSGQTMADLFGGHIQTIAEELELNPAQIRPWEAHSKWSPILGVRRGKRVVPLTESETRTFARKDPRFWKTAQGRELQAGMTQFLLDTFGARASQ
jgi:hypothetical protein